MSANIYPLSILKSAIGSNVMVELKSGDIY